LPSAQAQDLVAIMADYYKNLTLDKQKAAPKEDSVGNEESKRRRRDESDITSSEEEDDLVMRGD